MRWFIAAVAALVLASQANAQGTWPQRPVTLVVPFGAGGSADLTARVIAPHLQAKFGQPFVIDNKGGAGGSIGAGYVAKAPNDGYTLLVGTISSNAINAALYSRLAYDLDRDFQPVSRLVLFPNLMMVNTKLPVRSVPELIAYLKANPGKVNYGSSGIGTSSHLSVVMFALATGTDMTHIPFRSTSEVVNSMIGGNIDLGIDSMTTTIPFAQSGAVRALGVTTPQRNPSMPEPADHRGDAARLRGDGMAGPVRAGRDAAADRRPARRGREGHSRTARRRRPARRGRRRAGAAAAGGIRRLHPRRARQVEGGGAEVGNAHRMTRRRRPAIE